MDQEKRRRINAGGTVTGFTTAWSREPLAQALSELTGSAFYKELSDTRNVLAHRVTPGFEHRVTLMAGALTDAEEETYELAWRGEPLSSFIPATLEQAETELTTLWEAAAGFLEARVS